MPPLDVAVIEAGGFYEDAGNTNVDPAYDGFFAGSDPADTNPAVDWGFVTTPQQGELLIYNLLRTLNLTIVLTRTKAVANPCNKAEANRKSQKCIILIRRHPRKGLQSGQSYMTD